MRDLNSDGIAYPTLDIFKNFKINILSKMFALY